jgi:hypothetical protein
VTTLGFIGAKSVAGQVARKAVQLGYDVILSSSKRHGTQTSSWSASPWGHTGTCPSHRSGAKSSSTPSITILTTASDFPEATAFVAKLYDQFGFDTVNLGPLSESWRAEFGRPAFLTRPALSGASSKSAFYAAGAQPASPTCSASIPPPCTECSADTASPARRTWTVPRDS